MYEKSPAKTPHDTPVILNIWYPVNVTVPEGDNMSGYTSANVDTAVVNRRLAPASLYGVKGLLMSAIRC
jgi:hypothetical protein